MFSLIPICLVLSTQARPDLETSPGVRIEVRVSRPEAQLAGFLSWFEGTGSRDLASAYAAWKRKHPEARPTKALEAAFAAANAEMVGELAALDRSTFVFEQDRAGRSRWHAALPADDGSLEAVGIAFALTDGMRVESPANSPPVDRLGPEGAPFLSRGDDRRGVVIADSIEGLETARRLLAGPPAAHEPGAFPSGAIFASIRADRAPEAGPVPWRQVIEALAAGGCARLDLAAAIAGDGLEIDLEAHFGAEPAAAPAVLDPSVLAPFAADELDLAFAAALETSPAALDRVFAWIDRIEKADPARAGVAPARVRLAFLAAGARLRPEADLIRRLRAVSIYLLKTKEAGPRSMLVGLHCVDDLAARTLIQETLPRASRALGAGEPSVEQGALRWGDTGPLARFRAEAIGSTVWVGRPRDGDDAPHLYPAQPADPERRWTRGLIEPNGRVQRVGFARSTLLSPELPDSGIATWVGRFEGSTSRDRIRWTGGRSAVRALLDHHLGVR
ncbi:MAG: hypothetical protein SFX72_14730 [Isosphaeraceae bacterium]|nr:hypothetical protein [Isosphaeraceae bacterium]